MLMASPLHPLNCFSDKSGVLEAHRKDNKSESPDKCVAIIKFMETASIDFDLDCKPDTVAYKVSYLLFVIDVLN